MQEILWGFIKEHYIFPSEQEKFGKNATIKKYLMHFRGSDMLLTSTVLRGLSLLNQFEYIMPNEWDTFVQQHTTLEAIALSNKMNELNPKNKFKHKIRPRGYMAAMPKWTKKEQELCEAGIPDPPKGCTVRIKNWI
jgi:hypothetical protein